MAPIRSALVVLAASAGSSLLAQSALAHPGHSVLESGSLALGFAHPLFGLDHLLAMLGVGMWVYTQAGAVSRTVRWRQSLWIPACFVACMGLGALGGHGGLGVAFVEQGILASLLLMGLMLCSAIRLPIAAGASLAGFFALFHGYAHALEMAPGAGFAAYAAGFSAASGLLLLAGGALASVLGLSARTDGAAQVGRRALWTRRVIGAGLSLSALALAAQ